jgi:two-component sensor histidine kinase
VALVRVNTDVSAQQLIEVELAETLAAKDMLLHEVNHRVKNSLQQVTSLLHLQVGNTSSPELKQGLLDARSRIAVVAGIHQQLYASGLHDRTDVVAYLRELASATITSVADGNKISFRFNDVCKTTLPIAKAVPLALITSELITNAVKYAFAPNNTGTVKLSIHSTSVSFEFEAADDGTDPPYSFDLSAAAGLGTRMVTALVRQLRGKLEMIALQPGTCVRVVVPKKD